MMDGWSLLCSGRLGQVEEWVGGGDELGWHIMEAAEVWNGIPWSREVLDWGKGLSCFRSW